MHRKIAVLAVAALVGGLLSAIAPAAKAQPPFGIAQFHPSDDVECQTVGGILLTADLCDQLSDRFDGTDALAHLTAVATEDTTRVVWYHCPSTTVASAADNTITQAEFNSCVVINEDASGVKPPGGAAGAPTDEAYDITWDIPSTLDRQLRDILALACTGETAGGNRVEAVSGQPANCKADVADNVSLDDAQTETPGSATVSPQPANEQTSAGEFTGYCTSDVVNGGPDRTPGNAPTVTNNPQSNPCQITGVAFPVGGTGTPNATERTTVNNNFRAFPHGSPVPDNGFVVRATTDLDVTQLFLVIYAPSDVSGIGAVISAPPCSELPESPTSTHRVWECVVEDGDVPDSAELAITLVEGAGGGAGSGYCDATEAGEVDPGTGPGDATADDPDGDDDTNCQLDSHYGVSSARGPNTTQASFQPNVQTGSPAANAGTPACDTGEAQDKAETNPINAQGGTGGGAAGTGSEVVVGCLVDQFLNQMNARTVTFESATTAPNAQIFGCAPNEPTAGALIGAGTLHDHDGDGRNEHCHTTSDPDGEASALINNISQGTAAIARPSTQTVTFCDDPEIDFTGTAATQPPQHGCANAPATSKDVVVKTYVAFPTHIHLVFEGTPGADACHTGTKFKENTIGQSDTIIACTFDADDNPASTTINQGGTIQWVITTAAGGQTQLATRFGGNPPNETLENGRATAQIQAVNEGSDLITVRLLDQQGNLISTDFIEKRVRRAGETQPPTTAPGTPGPTTTTTTTATVPGSQTPTPTATLNPRALTLEASRSRVGFGKPFTLTGGITSQVTACAAGQTIVIRRTVVGTSTQAVFDTLTTNADGTFTKSYTADASANYIAHVDANGTCGEANSTAVPVTVNVSVNLAVSKQRVRPGARVVLTTKVAPCGNHAGTDVTLFRSVGGSFAKVAKKQLSSTCTAKFTQRVRRSTVFQTRWAKQDDDHLGGKSRKKAVRVRR